MFVLDSERERERERVSELMLLKNRKTPFLPRKSEPALLD